KAIHKLQKRLARLNKISFFPFPRRILYISEQKNINFISKLINISSEFSVQTFFVKFAEQKYHISPISIANLDTIEIHKQEKDMISETFIGKRIWIFYDGIKSVFDLIHAIYDIAELTVFCESEYFIKDLEKNIGTSEKSNIKIADKNLFLSADIAPDILFFNMPLLHLDSSENNLKEAFVKNVFNVSEIIEKAQKLKIKFVFLLSTTQAFNTNNWIGATQRLGELSIQCIDSVRKKTQTKFRIIRLPDCVTDPSGIFDQIMFSILNGTQVVLPSDNDSRNISFNKYYWRNDIFHPLINLISFSLKEHYISADIYSILPQYTNSGNSEDILNKICQSLCMRKGQDIKFEYTFGNGIDEIDHETNNLNISKELENTNIAPGVMRTKFSMTNLKYYNIPTWTIDQINKMSARDIIAEVFQSLTCNKNRGLSK
ncbi:MAG: polysaccharide biosynthesis protein, partial [Alphaproteobacteria bacterium]|nr:polysaccharide biosynthesis protein [Alphaproteobacteria bacterium]